MTYFFNSSILRSYDIRGIFNKDLKEEDAFFIGKSLVKFLNKSNLKIVVGYDGRNSSISLRNNLVKSLLESGVEVIDVGLGPSPMIYFASHYFKADASIMITGSHNPKNYNGFKISLKDRPFFGDDILNLASIAKKGVFINGSGKLIKKDIKELYVNRLLKNVKIQNNLKIAWDNGNGSCGEILNLLTQKINNKNILLFEEIDGNFPNHPANPSVEKNLQDLQKIVNDEKCNLGIAFDGDGDRLGVVDDKGDILLIDQLLCLFIEDILSNHPSSTIICDAKTSKIVFDKIRSLNGNALMWKTGHSLIKAKMKETNSIFAGEMSGHLFFKDRYYGFDDGIYSAIRLIELISQKNIRLSELKKSIPKSFSTSEIRISCSEEKKFKIIEKIKENLQKRQIKYDDIDGIRVEEESRWWIIRASNTEPSIVSRCEADSLELLEDTKLMVNKFIEDADKVFI